MTFVKMCGMTRVDDARRAADLGVQAVGVVFYAASPRAVTAQQAQAIFEALPTGIHRVGVFVDPDAPTVAAVAKACGLTHIQLQGSETPELARSLPLPAIKAIHVRDDTDTACMGSYGPHVQLFVLDTYVAGTPGGTGVTFDWSIAAQAAARHRILLAGGLTAKNVEEAIRRARPFGVDVSSGIESAPGVKHPGKMRAFMDAVRRADESAGGG